MTSGDSICSASFCCNERLICACRSNGFSVYSAHPLSHIKTCETGHQPGAIVALFNSTIAIYSGTKTNRQFGEKSVCVYDWSLGRAILNIECTEPVIAIISLSEMFAVTCPSSVRLYTIDPPSLFSEIRSATNPSAPCDFCGWQPPLPLCNCMGSLNVRYLWTVLS
jgi:hypothetical protein